MRTLTYREAVAEALREEMQRDETVFLVGEDIGRTGRGVFRETDQLPHLFGDKRVRETPIAESAIVGVAVGAAMTGLRPVAEIMFFDFITCAMDQVVNQAAKIPAMSGDHVKLPLVIKTQAGPGTRTAAQHSQSLEAWFVHTPGLKVVMPATPYDAKGLLKSSIRDDGPVVYIQKRRLYSQRESVPEGEWLVPIGEAAITRQGTDVTVVAVSEMLPVVMAAAAAVANEISIEVIDPRTLAPLDTGRIIESVKKTGKLLVTHQAPVRGGVGAEIVRQVTERAFDYLDGPPRVLGGADCPVPYSAPLEDACMVQEVDVIEVVRELLRRR